MPVAMLKTTTVALTTATVNRPLSPTSVITPPMAFLLVI
jgi:hypothetical protein